MGYIEKSLAGDEVIIAKAHFHWLYHLFAYALLILSLALAAYMYSQGQWPRLAAVLAATGMIVFLRVMVPIWSTEIGVTSGRVIFKRGFLTRHTEETQLSAIEEINVDQGILGRLLGFGRITVQGTGDDDVYIPATPVRCNSASRFSKLWRRRAWQAPAHAPYQTLQRKFEAEPHSTR